MLRRIHFGDDTIQAAREGGRLLGLHAGIVALDLEFPCFRSPVLGSTLGGIIRGQPQIRNRCHACSDRRRPPPICVSIDP